MPVPVILVMTSDGIVSNGVLACSIRPTIRKGERNEGGDRQA